MDQVDSARDGARAVLTHVASCSAAQRGAENFPVALRFLPRRPRVSLTRVYDFARFVDDVGDVAPGDRRRLLDLVESEVQSLLQGGSTLAVIAALGPVIDECGVPLEPFLDLIRANRVDQDVSRYETFDDLLGYCRMSAAPVGRIVLHVAGAATAANVRESDLVCAALQVLEHCQDVGEDARAGRVYLPGVDLRAAGVVDADLVGPLTSRRVRRVVSVQVDRAQDLLNAGRPLVHRLSGWARLAVGGYVAGGLATASALRAANYDVLARDIRPSRIRTAAHTARLVAAR